MPNSTAAATSAVVALNADDILSAYPSMEPEKPPHSKLASKWLGFVSALWVQAISGNNYTFANYSVELKAIMGVNQVQLNGLSSAKDVGKAFGVVAGFLCNYIPPWAILLIGSLEGLLGYGAQWLVISRRIRPLPYWLMCIVMCMGGNSTTWMNTAVLVTCVTNFRQNRGPVSGILKAYVGLSTAIFTDLCTALFGGDAAAFVLMLALIPLGVCIVAMLLLKPVECEPNVDGEREESRCFSLLNAAAIALALYLLAYDLSGIKEKLFSRLIAGGLSIILIAPVALPVYLHIKVARQKRQTPLHEPFSKQNGKEQGASREVMTMHKDVEDMSTAIKGEQKVHGHAKMFTIEEEGIEDRDVKNLKEGEAVERMQKVSAKEHESPADGHALGVLQDGRVLMNEDVIEMDIREGELKLHKDVEELCTVRGKSSVQVDAKKVTMKEEEGMADGDATRLFTAKGEAIASKVAERVLTEEQQMLVNGDVEKVSTTGGGQGDMTVHSCNKKLGDNFTVMESLKTFDFWLLFFCFLCGVGTGMAVINNMGQIGQSMGYSSVSTFVSLISIWGFFGRLGSGVLSEFLIRWKAVPRPVLLAVSQLVMVLGYVLLAVAKAGSLYIGSIVVGVCYGVRLSVSVPVASEMFGLKAFGMMYNLLILNLPLGSLLFSSLLAGFLYDREAAKEGSSTTCLGAHCYRLVFLLMATVSALGFVLDAILALRTRSLYQQIYRSKHSL